MSCSRGYRLCTAFVVFFCVTFKILTFHNVFLFDIFWGAEGVWNFLNQQQKQGKI